MLQETDTVTGSMGQLSEDEALEETAAGPSGQPAPPTHALQSRP